MIRVLVVDDSALAREALTGYLEEDRDLRVIGTAVDGRAAIRAVAELTPDVVTMDLAMPGGDGLAAIEQIMALHPVPIVVVTSRAASDPAVPFEALSRGALDVALKPSTPREASALRASVRSAAGIPVVTHVRALRAMRTVSRIAVAPREPGRIVGIAASAGGPAALDTVLGALPATLPACVAVVQHLPPDFVASFAAYLRTRTPLEVVLAPPAGVEAQPGRIVLAMPGHHLVASSPRLLAAAADPPLGGHRPSATLLFRSLARHAGDRAVGVVLTGIGDDGAAGLAELRARGAHTIGQDQQTSTVYGMPQAAVAAGAVARVLPLQDIAREIRRAVGEGDV